MRSVNQQVAGERRNHARCVGAESPGVPACGGPRTMTFRPWLVGPWATMYSMPVSYTSMGSVLDHGAGDVEVLRAVYLEVAVEEEVAGFICKS